MVFVLMCLGCMYFIIFMVLVSVRLFRVDVVISSWVVIFLGVILGFLKIDDILCVYCGYGVCNFFM